MPQAGKHDCPNLRRGLPPCRNRVSGRGQARRQTMPLDRVQLQRDDPICLGVWRPVYPRLGQRRAGPLRRIAFGVGQSVSGGRTARDPICPSQRHHVSGPCQPRSAQADPRGRRQLDADHGQVGLPSGPRPEHHAGHHCCFRGDRHRDPYRQRLDLPCGPCGRSVVYSVAADQRCA